MELADLAISAYKNTYNLQNKLAERNQIVFFGDSLTARYRLKSHFPNYVIHNRGIIGDTTFGMLDRLQENVFPLLPKKLFFLGGTNDLNEPDYNIDKTMQNIKNIIEKTIACMPDIKIYVQSIYPVNQDIRLLRVKNKVQRRTNEEILRLNEMLKKLCDREQITYINVHDMLQLHGKLNKKYTSDGLHINKFGYAIVTKILEKYL